jgi:hypothetical protein
LQRTQFFRGGGVVFGPAPRGQPEPQRQLGVVVQGGGVQLDVAGVEIHDVTAGQPGGRHVVQQRGEPVAAAGDRLGRDDRSDQPDRTLFEQVPGGLAMLVADDDRAGGELPRALDPGPPQRLPAGQRRVPVEQVEAGGQAAQHVFDRGEPDRGGAEHVGIQAPSIH